MMHIAVAWKEWWDGLGHVARCNRDEARIREAFEAGYMAALAQTKIPTAADPDVSVGVHLDQSRRGISGVQRRGQ